MPDIDHFQPHLLHVRGLFFPPLVADVIHQLATLDPSGAVPLEALVDPVVVDPTVHTMLHLQHVQNGISIHRANNTVMVIKMLARKHSVLLEQTGILLRIDVTLQRNLKTPVVSGLIDSPPNRSRINDRAGERF